MRASPERGRSMAYDPEKHHRRSIRLKGHDYAGGGLYFVTLCAHRDAGDVFADEAAKKIVAERVRITEEKFSDAKWVEWVVMPDHFHALIQMDGGHLRLGDIIGGFKSAVSREWRATRVSPVRRGEARLAPLWQRNYYEMIVRSDDAAKRIAEYIRMNPWKCVQEFGDGLRGIGNPALWNGKKLGVLCSRVGAKKFSPVPEADVYFGGWHSPKEKEIFDGLLEQGKRVISCPAWGIATKNLSPVLEALKGNRLLILEMRNREGDLAAAEQRNRFVVEHADELFVPHVTPGGMLERLLNEKKMGR